MLNQFMNEAINQCLQAALRRGEAAEQPVDVEESDEFGSEVFARMGWGVKVNKRRFHSRQS